MVWRTTAPAPRPLPAQANFAVPPALALGLGVLALLGVLGILVKRDLPKEARIAIALLGPVASGVILYSMGMKNDIPLYKLTLLSLPFGGALVAALIYKAHA
jgi:hypothetical protein